MNAEQATAYEFDGFRLIPGRRLVTNVDGEPVPMRGKAFDLLHYLVRYRGRLVEKAELLAALWPNTVVEDNNLNQAVSALRHALQDSMQSPKMIATVTGRGYQFIAEVHVIADEPAPLPAPAELPTAPKARRPARVAAFGGIVAVVLAAILLVDRFSAPDGSVPVLDRYGELAPQLVTDLPGSHSDPTLSPDGTWMAWVGDVDGVPQLFVRNLELGDSLQITDGAADSTSPSWSPDNGRIVFARGSPRGPGIYSVGTLGTPEPQPIIEFGHDPSFAADADVFTYAVGQQVWVAGGDGRNRRQVAGLPVGRRFAARTPALSPDASLVAYVHADEGPVGNLWISPTDGGPARQLTAFTINDLRSVLSPAFSPDGRSIVYSVSTVGGGTELFRIPVVGGEPVVLGRSSGVLRHGAISRDGRRLAYTDTRERYLLSRVDPVDGQRSAIVDSRYPVFLPVVSADGARVVYFSLLPSGAQLFSIDTDGTGLRQLTHDDAGVNTLPFWSDDGEIVYYYRDRSLHRLHLADGRDEQVIADFHWSSRNWGAVHGDRLAYHEFDIASGHERSAIRNLADGSEIDLPVGLEGMRWSRDGRELLGFTRPPNALVICEVDSLRCTPLAAGENPVRGTRPQWSPDEQSIYYLRTSADGGCCAVWIVDRDGSNGRALVEMTGYSASNSLFGIDADGGVIFNHIDRSGDEIWVVAAE